MVTLCLIYVIPNKVIGIHQVMGRAFNMQYITLGDFMFLSRIAEGVIKNEYHFQGVNGIIRYLDRIVHQPSVIIQVWIVTEEPLVKRKHMIQIMNGYECNGTDIFMR